MSSLLNLSGITLFFTIIFMLSCGLFECFMGYKIVRGIMLGTGLCAGFAFGWNLCSIIISQIEISSGFDTLFQITISIMFALIVSMLAYLYPKTAMFITCSFAVFIIVYSMLGLSGVNTMLSVIPAIFAGIAFGGLTVKFFRPFTIISSSIFGGILISCSVYLFSKNRYGNLVDIIPGLFFTVTGLIVQLKKYGKPRHIQEEKK